VSRAGLVGRRGSRGTLAGPPGPDASVYGTLPYTLAHACCSVYGALAGCERRGSEQPRQHARVWASGIADVVTWLGPVALQGKRLVWRVRFRPHEPRWRGMYVGLVRFRPSSSGSRRSGAGPLVS
jgi:hypothetical protein